MFLLREGFYFSGFSLCKFCPLPRTGGILLTLSSKPPHTEERRIKGCHDLIHVTRAAEAEAAHLNAPIFAHNVWSGSHRAVRALPWASQMGWRLEAASHPGGPALIPQLSVLGLRTDEKGDCTSSSVPQRHLGCQAGAMSCPTGLPASREFLWESRHCQGTGSRWVRPRPTPPQKHLACNKDEICCSLAV